ncbi:MAG: OmpA family protein [Myxococcales bacterium]|nr:OmpA family protein [Myxococcales bacterium]
MRFLASQLTFGRLGALLSLLCLGLVLTGCPDKKPKFPNCKTDKDCKDGQHCFQKHCSECSEDSHCEEFETCDRGTCILGDGMCRTNDDCTAGQICENNECNACESDSECGPDARCSNGACLERGSCNEDEDCADDEDCIDGTCQRAGRLTPPKLSCSLDSVYFGLDEFSIPEDSREGLHDTSVCIQQGDQRNVFVEGHTDESGTDEYNIALSEKRGRSVADFLARLGIDPARLRVIPKGETEATGTDEDSRSEERRVDFEWQ